VNGKLLARGATTSMLFSFEEILAYASQDETVHASAFFGSGAVGNELCSSARPSSLGSKTNLVGFNV
jgi:2-keto-4-pentenoate hydratase/2-oxohepta-3-ene-1,7-dioic acid hydratase in catechol pathway